VNVQLCKKSIERLPVGLPAALSLLRDRQHTPILKDCLNRCQSCERGSLVAVADGTPLGAASLEALLDDLDALADDDD
jgi:hypothetical protein